MQQNIHNEEQISTYENQSMNDNNPDCIITDQNIAYGSQTFSGTTNKHNTVDMIQEIYDDTVHNADATQQIEIYEELDVPQIESPIEDNVLVSSTQGKRINFCSFN